MTGFEQCSMAGCKNAAATSLEGDPLCREHFISICYTRLDEYDEIRKGSRAQVSDSEIVRRFVHECTRNADELEHDVRGLDNLERAKLVHIILSAAELGRHLRRSPRKVASIAVRLSSEKIGGAWEDSGEAVLLSRHGALVRCRHLAKTGETLEFERADTGERAQARVAWQRTSEGEEARIGVEFLYHENFWGLDWGAVEEAR